MNIFRTAPPTTTSLTPLNKIWFFLNLFQKFFGLLIIIIIIIAEGQFHILKWNSNWFSRYTTLRYKNISISRKEFIMLSIFSFSAPIYALESKISDIKAASYGAAAIFVQIFARFTLSTKKLAKVWTKMIDTKKICITFFSISSTIIISSAQCNLPSNLLNKHSLARSSSSSQHD